MGKLPDILINNSHTEQRGFGDLILLYFFGLFLELGKYILILGTVYLCVYIFLAGMASVFFSLQNVTDLVVKLYPLAEYTVISFYLGILKYIYQHRIHWDWISDNNPNWLIRKHTVRFYRVLNGTVIFFISDKPYVEDPFYYDEN